MFQTKAKFQESKERVLALKPTALQTVEECDDALLLLDEVIAKIETQLEYSDLDEKADERWEIRAEAALKLTKAKREAVLRRKQATINKWARFWTALKERFGEAEIQTIWRQA